MYSTLYTKSKACYTFVIRCKANFTKGDGELRNRIQELRKDRKLTQSELADQLEVTRQTIISLENGRYNASLILAHKIARYFDSSIEEVFMFEEDEDDK